MRLWMVSNPPTLSTRRERFLPAPLSSLPSLRSRAQPGLGGTHGVRGRTLDRVRQIGLMAPHDFTTTMYAGLGDARWRRSRISSGATTLTTRGSGMAMNEWMERARSISKSSISARPNVLVRTEVRHGSAEALAYGE